MFPNIINRDFSTSSSNQKWTGDITYIPTKEGWLYLAVVIDLYSRAVIGWSMSRRLKKSLVFNALTMALFRRRFPRNVIVHSDRCSQYCSKEYRKLLEKNKLVGSMSRKANCWDIAPTLFKIIWKFQREVRPKILEVDGGKIDQLQQNLYDVEEVFSMTNYKS